MFTSRRTSITAALLAAGTALLTTPAFAQADDHGQAAHDDDAQDEIVVSGHLPVDMGLLAGTASLEGDALVAEMRGQVGEMLARLPGVSATSFSPGASRPVLRGLDGDRIRVLVDGIGSVDASSVSADHAVVFDPLTTDHIDVVHGPAVLLFGGQAIGGAVNAIDKRIPRKVPDGPQASAMASYGSAADERFLGGSIEMPLAPRLALHLDASWRKSDDLRVAGFVNSPEIRDDLLADAQGHRALGEIAEAEGLESLANLRDRIPNSATRSRSFGGGLAFIDQGGSIGLSVQRFDSRYGVPMRPGAGHGHGAGPAEEPAPVSIDLVQTRIDLRAELKLAETLGGAFEALQLRGAFGDYRHIELEGTDEGTRFSGKGVEFRADLIQSDRGGWRGRSGVQFQARTMNVQGPEANTPDNTTQRWGLFTLQSLAFGSGLEAQLAGRYERATVIARSVSFERSFDLWSGAAGLSWEPAEGWKLGVNYIRGARAPAPEELLSDGLHVATQSYELGDPLFKPETSRGMEAYVRYRSGRFNLSLTGYRTRFNRFITALPTGAERDGMPEFAYAQTRATFKGLEAEADVTVLGWQQGKLKLDAALDYTHAELDGIGPVPRIPPLRLRGGAEVELTALHLRGEVEWNAAQNRVPAFETPEQGFTTVNLSADWHPMGEQGALTVILAANNVLNAHGRRAASFTRGFVPVSGRDLRLTARIEF